MPSLRTIRCAIALLAVACGEQVPAMGGVVDPAIGSGGEPESTSGGDDGAVQPSTGGGLDESSDDGGIIFIPPTDAGASFECDLFTQDCAPGEKCNVWANDGGSAWNATKCVPIDPDPGKVGEDCTVTGSGVSGIDSCELGAMCWHVDAEGLGTCVGFCQGSADNPLCEDPTASCEGRDVPLCLPTCCPIEQNCHAGAACYPANNHFACVADASGEQGAFGDPCEYTNACDPGLACIGAQALPDCEGSLGCCTSFCEVGSQACELRHPDLRCVPWYTPGQAPPGEEAVGICVLEQ